MSCYKCENNCWDFENQKCKFSTEGSKSPQPAGYDAALKELRNLLTDCIQNREEADPELKDEKWKGYIQGVEMAIYRLEMNNVS